MFSSFLYFCCTGVLHYPEHSLLHCGLIIVEVLSFFMQRLCFSTLKTMIKRNSPLSSCSGTQEDSRGLWHGPGFPSVPGPAGLHARACIPRWERPDLLPGPPDGGAAQYDQWVSDYNSYCSSLCLCAYVVILKSNFGTGMEKCNKSRYQIEFLLLRNIDTGQMF